MTSTKIIFFLVGCLLYGQNLVFGIKLKFETDLCNLIEPIYNFTFDFNPLNSDLSHTIIDNELGQVEFNLCGNSSRKCNSKYGACLKKSGKEFLLGTSHKLNYDNGKIFFKFINGENCTHDKNYELIVEVNCDYTFDQKQIEIIKMEGSCSYYLKLETSYACLPEPALTKTNKCSVKNNKTDYIFDLLPLSDFNYRVSANDEDFVINICKPVLYGQNSMCPEGSSICFVKKDAESLKFVNYGTVTNKPIFDDLKNQLIMTHLSETQCNSTHNFTSTIYFLCNINSGDGKPEFKNKNDCHYEFIWETSFACEKFEPCQGVDPNTGINYDFTSLINKTVQLNSKDGKKYVFGLCSQAGQPCIERNGACEINDTQTTSLGISNDRLRFNKGTIYLEYSSGAKCSESKTGYYSTRIEFLCPNIHQTSSLNIGDNATVVENSNCSLKIHYATKLACFKKISCKIQGKIGENSKNLDDHIIDLTSLINSEENYQANINESTIKGDSAKKLYFLNVCRPLVASYGLGCPAGSSACIAIKGEKNPENEKGLGYPVHSVSQIDNNQIELMYTNGDICSENNKTQMSSTIKFICDLKAAKGLPILQSITNDCNYKFDWHTNVICPEHICSFDANTCDIINDELNSKFNLKNSKFTENGKIIINESKPLNIEICGKNRRIKSDYSEKTVKISFSINEFCHKQNAPTDINVVLHLVCNATEQRSFSRVGDSCDLIITQQTPEICSFLGLQVPLIVTTETTTLNHSEQTKSTTTITTPTTTTTTTTTLIPITSVTKVLPTASHEEAKKNIIINSTGSIIKQNTTSQDIHSSDSTSSMSGIILTLLLSISAIAVVAFLILRNPNRRALLRRLFRRNSGNSVRYVRVDASEDENLLMQRTSNPDETDDEMLL